MRCDTAHGQEAVLACVRRDEPRVVVVPYLCDEQRAFVKVVTGTQESAGRRFAICMLDDSVLETRGIPAPHPTLFPGSLVLHNLHESRGNIQMCVFTEEARVTTHAIEKLLELGAVPLNVGRKNLRHEGQHQSGDGVHSMIFGAYSSYGLGVSPNGFKRHELLKLLHSLACERPRGAGPYATMNVCVVCW
eukprot:4448201-Amphidinium_carterae.3